MKKTDNKSKQTSKSTKTNTKLTKNLDDKKPPKITTNTNSKNIEQDKKQEDYLKGEDHTSHIIKENNSIIDKLEKLDKMDFSSIEPTNLQTENNVKKTEVKPREDYLKKKINEMNINTEIVSGVSKSLGKQIENIEKDMDSNELLITEVKKDLSKLIKNKSEESLLISKDIVEEKQKLHSLKELQNREVLLKNKLNKLEQTENLINNKSSALIDNKDKSLIEDNIKKQQLKEIKLKKEELNDRINEINYHINKMLFEENVDNRKIRIKKFLDNFEKDKEIIIERAKKYERETKERDEKRKNDADKIAEKVKEQLKMKEEEDKKKREEILKKFRDDELKVYSRRIKENKQIVEKYKEFRNNKPKEKEKDYIYYQNQKNYEKENENQIKKEKIKRKALMRSVPLEEIKEFDQKLDEEKNKINDNEKNKKKLLEEKWKENKEKLPKYISPFYSNPENDIKKQLEDKEIKKEKIDALIKTKLDYAEKIKQPSSNPELKKKRETIIKNLTEKPVVKDTLLDHKKNRILLKKRDPNKPSKYKWKLKLEDENSLELNYQNEINKKIYKKPKKLNISFENKRKEIPDKKIDYLTQLKNERELAEKNDKQSISKKTEQNIKRWDKMLKKDGNIVDNVNNVKQQAEIFEREAEQKEKFLRYNGGIEKNPELGQQVSNLIINSIQAKLSILNTVNNN